LNPPPQRSRPFKLSNDPAFAAKVEGVVGLYVDPLRPAGKQARL